jgi:pilus assembly protein CpaB
MNRRFVLALGISATMALLVSAVFYQIAVRGRSAPAEPTGTQEIVVATRDLDIGATVGPADLRLENWPANRVPEDGFLAIDEVIEGVPVARILAGEPVMRRRLAPPGSGVGLSPKVPVGMRAISVRVDDVTGLAGFVLPEAHVDVLVTGTPLSSPELGRMTRTILSKVRVITAGENLEADASGKPQRVAVVTLLVTPEQAELLTLASAQGRLQLVLRNARDEDVVETRGVRERQMFAMDWESGSGGEGGPARREPQPAATLALPPAAAAPPPVQIELIRGTVRSVESFTPASR